MRKRDIWIVICALLLAAAVSLRIFRQEALETGSWGLSFRQEGMPPHRERSRREPEGVQWSVSWKHPGEGAVSDL